MKDALFEEPIPEGLQFQFDERVASVFDDMAVRSIPLYRDLQALSAALAKSHYIPGTKIYDIGCSTGTTLVQLSAVFGHPLPSMIGVDSSSPMLEQAQRKINSLPDSSHISLLHERAENTVIDHASIVIMHYTLQFTPPDMRHNILKTIGNGLVPGGILLLSEKVKNNDEHLTEELEQLYYDFKRKNGYSEREIAQKRAALQGVLIPTTLEELIGHLKSAGFSHYTLYLCAYNFVSILAKHQ